MLESKVDFTGFDYQQIGIYCVLTISKPYIAKFGSSKFVPVRVVKKREIKNHNLQLGDKFSKSQLVKLSFSPITTNSKQKKLMLSTSNRLKVINAYQ